MGGGGMGDLYLATHKTLGGKWAIKVLAADLSEDPKVVERFVNEAKIVRPAYRRYLERRLRELFDFTGAPIRIAIRSRREKPGG